MGRTAGFKPGQDEEDDLPWYVFGDARRAALAARKSPQSGRALPVVEREMPGSQFLAPKKREQSRMGSDANIDKNRIGKGSFTANIPTKRATKPRVASKPAGEYVAPSSIESQQTAGIQGLPGAQSGMAQEAGSEYGRTTYFGETPEQAAQVAEQMSPQQMRKGLFGEDISQEDYDRMTQKNKEGSFWGQFKKGGQVKKKPVKKYAKGGTVSSASKRGDGICQRGKTKGRMV